MSICLARGKQPTQCLVQQQITTCLFTSSASTEQKLLSCAGGIAVTLAGHPFDTAKVRLQTQSSTNPIYCECVAYACVVSCACVQSGMIHACS